MSRTLLEYYKDLEEDGVVLFFNGPVSQSVVEGIGSLIRQKVATTDKGMQVARKVFAVLVEQMQNIICYSLDATTIEPPAIHGNAPQSMATYGSGQIIVRRNEEGYYVACSNRIQTSHAQRIKDKIATINAMSKDELKAYYKQQRKAGPDAESLGAGLGFIEMARKASKPLDVEFQPLDEHTSVFSVAVSI